MKLNFYMILYTLVLFRLNNNISKFNPHTALRGELLSLLFDDVTKSHKLL